MIRENARRPADMLGYRAFGRGQPKSAERDVMRTSWLGSCSWQLAQARTLRPLDKAMAPPAVEMPGLPGTAVEPGAPDRESAGRTLDLASAAHEALQGKQAQRAGAHRARLSLARSGHLLRTRESGPYGRSDSAARPDTNRQRVRRGLPLVDEAAEEGEVSISRILGNNAHQVAPRRPRCTSPSATTWPGPA